MMIMCVSELKCAIKLDSIVRRGAQMSSMRRESPHLLLHFYFCSRHTLGAIRRASGRSLWTLKYSVLLQLWRVTLQSKPRKDEVHKKGRSFRVWFSQSNCDKATRTVCRMRKDKVHQKAYQFGLTAQLVK